MAAFHYKSGRSIADISAEDVGAELTRIHDKHGELQPSLVVRESRPKSACLHKVFEWNDQTAAEEYRIQQARQIINIVTVVHEDMPASKPLQAFINVTVVNDEDEKKERRYVPMRTVVENPGLLAQHLEHLKRRLKTMRVEHAAFEELRPVWEAIDSLA